MFSSLFLLLFPYLSCRSFSSCRGRLEANKPGKWPSTSNNWVLGVLLNRYFIISFLLFNSPLSSFFHMMSEESEMEGAFLSGTLPPYNSYDKFCFMCSFLWVGVWQILPPLLLPISFFLLYLRPKRESINLFTKCVGVAAALSLADYARAAKRTDDEIVTTATLLRNARPTAVNLMFAIDKMIQVGQSTRDFSPEKYEKEKGRGWQKKLPYICQSHFFYWQDYKGFFAWKRRI